MTLSLSLPFIDDELPVPVLLAVAAVFVVMPVLLPALLPVLVPLLSIVPRLAVVSLPVLPL